MHAEARKVMSENGKKGGKARWVGVSKRRRTSIARAAAKARWSKR